MRSDLRRCLTFETNASIMLFKCYLFLSIIITVTLGYNIKPGPKVPPTKGEVWPKPQLEKKGTDFLELRVGVFKFQIKNYDCQLLQQALKRYYNVINYTYLKSTRYSKGRYRTYDLWRSNKNFKRYLDHLTIDLLTPCSDNDMPSLTMDESYELNVTASDQNEGILKANSIWGIFRGIETFSQLLYLSNDDQSLILNVTSITDFPRFPHRGFMLDTARHYIPIPSILKTLDAMSYNKLNIFHWHIVDDQSFPYVSKVFPELSAMGAYHPVRFQYNPDQVQKVIRYAADRGIRVMVEFDTPGHTRSWGEAFPDILTTCYKDSKPDGYLGPMDPTKNITYKFLQTLYQEIIEVFPDKYVHIGGDEVDFDCWQSNSNITTFMKLHNIANYAELEELFVQKLVDIVKNLGFQSIVWQEVFENGVKLPKDTVVQIWKDNYWILLSKVTKAGYKTLLSSCWYLDSLQSGGDWEKFYECEPLGFIGTPEQKKLVIGGETCMWAEVVDGTNVLSRVWPRASAAAEKLWSNVHVTDLKEAAHRLEEHACRMNRRNIPAQPPNGPGFCV